MMNKNKDKQPYSYHTFIFPFLWNDSGRVTREQFKKCINDCWIEEKIEYNEDASDVTLYNQYHYFNRAARNAMYTTDFTRDAVVWNYRFDLKKIDQNARANSDNIKLHKEWVKEYKDFANNVRYTVQKGDFKAELSVNGFRLKLFNTGVGMLFFEFENYEDLDEETIIKINEFGRRVFLPYIFKYENNKNGCSLFPDSVCLSVHGNEIVSEKLEDIELSDETDTVLIKPIAYLLSNSVYNITTKETHADNEFYIEPIIDDRMFVACFWENGTYVSEVTEWENGEYKYLSDAKSLSLTDENNLSARLYKMIFVDGDGLSCFNRDMMYELLNKAVYGRWNEYAYKDDETGDFVKSATVSGITEYSFVTISNSAEYTKNPFLTQYIEMAVLVLAQRASLLAFERIISEIACRKSDMSVDMVQRDYVMFQSELLLQEVTAQQQGIELYDMLLENLFINKQQKEIEGQIKSLFELNTSHHEKAENFILFILALLSISEAVQTIFGDWFGLGSCICLAVSLVCLAAIGIWKLRRNKKWRG